MEEEKNEYKQMEESRNMYRKQVVSLNEDLRVLRRNKKTTKRNYKQKIQKLKQENEKLKEERDSAIKILNTEAETLYWYYEKLCNLFLE